MTPTQRYDATHREQRRKAALARYYANKERLQAQHAVWVAEHPDYQAEWRADNPEKVAAAQSRFKERHPNRVRAKTQAWRKRNPETYAAGQKAWRDSNTERLREHARRRRALQAGVLLTVKVTADECGVCQEPLTDRAFPDPKSTTIGHEPPLTVASREGWTVVAERPEHWKCNRRKWAKPDYQLEAA